MKLKLPRREKIVLSALLICVVIVTSAFSVFAAVTHRTLQNLRAALSDAGHEAAVAAPMLAGNALYTLRSCGGKIGIYDATSGLLLDFVDVLVETLPEQDRLALARGITLYSFSDLASIIEDFST